MAQKLETPKSFNWIEDGILHSVAKDKAYLDIEDAIAITRAFQELSPSPIPLLVDLARTTGQSPETRKYFSADPIHISSYSAVALLVSNPVGKVLANFYLGLNKPSKPTRLFTSKEEALKWLQEFL